MKLITSLLLLFIYTLAQADIYKGKDAEGQTIYSDQELPDTQKIPTPSPNTIQMPKLEKKKSVQNKDTTDDTTNYTLFNISSPTNGETVRSNTGDISIALTIDPELDTNNGHRIVIYLDNQPVISTATESDLQLNNVSRGEHSLRAEVRNAKGKSVISSRALTIYMKRLSGQHKKPSGTPPGPVDTEGNPYQPGPQGTRFVPGPTPPPTETP